jgi:hypothetical protein
MTDLSIWESIPSSKQSASNRKTTHGVGINDAPFVTKLRINGKNSVHPALIAWQSMIKRAYSSKFHETDQSYIGVSVCEMWHKFSSFLPWWKDNHVEGWELDKDILSDARHYCPASCLYIPSWLNMFINDHRAARGEWPIGAYKRPSGRFGAHCNNTVSGKCEWLGTYDCPEVAHLAWKARKLEIADELKVRMDEIDPRIHPRVRQIIESKR